MERNKLEREREREIGMKRIKKNVSSASVSLARLLSGLFLTTALATLGTSAAQAQAQGGAASGAQAQITIAVGPAGGVLISYARPLATLIQLRDYITRHQLSGRLQGHPPCRKSRSLHASTTMYQPARR